jgi:hypothetical protein
MDAPFQFDDAQFNRLFPFFIRISRDLKVVATGNSLKKLFPISPGADFTSHFSIPRPFTPIEAFENLLSLKNQLVVLESVTTNSVKLRGQFELLANGSDLLFVGSPWFGSMEQVMENNLLIGDFAFHDPLIDLLHVVKSQDITNRI